MAIKIKFNVPAQIKNIAGRRETFKPGTYDLDDKIIDHWFIQGLIAAGKVSILESAIKPEPAKPKQQELPLTAPAAKPVPVQKPEPVKPVVADLKQKGIEIEEIKPSASKKIEVSESIAAPPKEEVKKVVLKRKKRAK